MGTGIWRENLFYLIFLSPFEISGEDFMYVCEDVHVLSPCISEAEEFRWIKNANFSRLMLSYFTHVIFNTWIFYFNEVLVTGKFLAKITSIHTLKKKNWCVVHAKITSIMLARGSSLECLYHEFKKVYV